MDNIVDFDIGLDILESTLNSNIFTDFCEDVDELNDITMHELYVEKVIDHNQSFKGRAKDSLASGGKFAASTAGTYFNIVDAGGNLLKNTWDLIMRAINLMSRIVKFITNKIADIPRIIGRAASKVSRIGPNLRDKIQGNISIFVPAEDIEMLYKGGLFNHVSDFLTLAETLSRGNFWGTMLLWNRRKDEKAIFPVNDRKICRQMDAIYFKIKMVNFKQSTIEINKGANRDLYFGDSKSVSFKDLSGKQHQCTYYDALQIIIKDIGSQQDKLKVIDEALTKKLDLTKGNQAFSKLDFVTRGVVTDTIGMVSKTIAILGNLTKAIISDMRIIEENTNKILRLQGVQPKTNASKDAKQAAKDANKIPKEKK